MAGFAMVWALAAVISDGTTFHLAPVIVAGVPAMSWAGHRMAGLMVGMVGATAVALLLSLTGLLDGPSLLPFGGALVESVAGAVFGGIVGLIARTMLSDAPLHERIDTPAVG